MTGTRLVVVLLATLAPAVAHPAGAPALLAMTTGGAARPATVFTAEGGRVRGTILEAGPGGVSVQVADGSTRKYDAAQVARIDYDDGTSWAPTPPAAGGFGAAPKAPTAAATAPSAAATAPAAAAPVVATAGPPGASPVPASAPAKPPTSSPASAPAPAAKEAAPIVLPIDKLDTVYLANGGRVRGLVVEESPADGLVVRLVDGAERRYAPGEALLVQYANGTVSAQPKPPPKTP
jgi:hypothetical protein